MPSLVLFGRRTPVAGDDLRFFSLVSFVIRLLQFSISISLLVLLLQHKHRNTKLKIIQKAECEDDGYSMADNGLEIALAYVAVSIFLSIVEMASDVPMYIVSGRGTPTDTEPRKNLHLLCYFKLLCLNVLKCIACTLGFISFFILEEYCDCLEQDGVLLSGFNIRQSCPHLTAWIYLLLTLVVTHTIDAGYSVLCLLYFGCKCMPSISSNLLHPETKWKAFCHCCCGLSSILTCCLFGGAAAIVGDFADFAYVMANYFDDNNILDVTASDIIVGVLMVRRVQQEELLESRRQLRILSQSPHLSESMPIRSTPPSRLSESNHSRPSLSSRAVSASTLHSGSVDTLNCADKIDNKNSSSLSYSHSLSRSFRSDEGDAEEAAVASTVPNQHQVLRPSHLREKYLIAEGARFMAMAQAMYTWISYLLEHPVTGLCDLACRATFRSVCCQHSLEGTVIGDYTCRQHSIALETISGIAPEDIVYAQFRQGIMPKPYAIVLDHEWKSIVIAIRGTLSLEDMLADLTLRPIELETIGQECGFDGKGRYCHAGIFGSSEWIYRDLARYVKALKIQKIKSD
jgi:sn1-specific diacylglycerol lipase